MKRLAHISLLVLLFLLTLQTHYEFTHPTLQGIDWDFGQMNLYGTDILFVIALGLILLSKAYRPVRFAYLMPMLALGAAMMVATFFVKAEPMSWYVLMRFVEGVVLGWMLAASRVPFRQLVLAFALGVTANAVFGIGQFIFQWVPANKWLGLASQQASVEGAAIVADRSSRYLRAYGFLPYPNILGLYLSLGFTSLLWLFIDRFQIVRSKAVKERWISIGLLLCLACLALALVFSFSRAAWLGTGIACMLLAAAVIATKNFRAIYMFGIGILISAVAVGALYTFYAPLVFNRIEMRGGHEVRSVEDRSNSFSDAAKLIDGHWLSGVGLGQSSYEIVRRIDPYREAYQANPVQNLFYLLAVEAGIVSAIAMVLVVWFASWDACKKWYATRKTGMLHPSSLGFALIIALVVMGFFGNYLPTLPAGIFLLFAIFGLTIKSSFQE